VPKEVKKPKGDRPKKPWEQGTVFAAGSGMDMTQMTASERLHAEKDASGRSVNAVKGAERTNAEKDASGRSVNAVKGGIKGAERTNAEKDASGRSVNAVKGAERLHAEKDASGRSVNAVKGAERTNAVKKEVKGQEAARAKVVEANKQGSLIGMDVQSVASAPDPRKSR
jgi:hypothetical protein